jgi:RNase P/RNase MRP subunit p30
MAENLRDLRIVLGGDEKRNRKAVEDKKTDILLSPEEGAKKDFMHSRNSGLNQILCKIARQNKVGIGFSFNKILNTSGMERAQILGRMMQNVVLCRKYKVQMFIVNHTKTDKREKGDLRSFGVCLGMHPKEIKVLYV